MAQEQFSGPEYFTEFDPEVHSRHEADGRDGKGKQGKGKQDGRDPGKEHRW